MVDHLEAKMDNQEQILQTIPIHLLLMAHIHTILWDIGLTIVIIEFI